MKEGDKIGAPVPMLRNLALQPTDDVLRREAAEAVNVLTNVWDGEVEVLVLMVRKGSNRCAWAISPSVDVRERLRRLLKEVWESSSHMDMLLKKNAPTSKL